MNSGSSGPWRMTSSCTWITHIIRWPLARYQLQEGTVGVPLSLDPYGSVFVVLSPGPPGHRYSAVRSVEGPANAVSSYSGELSVSKKETVLSEFTARSLYREEWSDGSLQNRPPAFRFCTGIRVICSGIHGRVISQPLSFQATLPIKGTGP
jgi:hypothetical protein